MASSQVNYLGQASHKMAGAHQGSMPPLSGGRKHEEGAATWWWSGTLQGGDASFEAFFEVFPKNADKFAVLRATICDGHEAWQVLQTSSQMITRSTSCGRSTIRELMSLLNNRMSDNFVVSRRKPSAEPVIAIELAQNEGQAKISFSDGYKITTEVFALELMRYIERLGDEVVRERATLRVEESAIKDLSGEIKLRLEARKPFDAEIAQRMRLLLQEKRNRPPTP